MSRCDIYARKLEIPLEIMEFLYNLFEFYECRGQVGRQNGLVFEIRTKEANHTMPHLHISYGDYQISISILDGLILSGNLPAKKQREAQKWVIQNQNNLLKKWHNIHVDKPISFLQSHLYRYDEH